jgi:hypothetical protein
MTDPTPNPTDPAPTDPLKDPAQEPTDWKAEAERLKGEARKWETRSKENAAAAKRLGEIEESQKTDLQKALDRAEAAERRAAEVETVQQIQAWKADIAKATGVPAQYLRGTTEDELKAHAEELAPVFKDRGPTVPTVGQIPTTTPSDDRETVRRLFGTTQ